MTSPLSNTGTVQLGGAGLADATLTPGGILMNAATGTIIGHGTIGNSVLNNGTVSPGSSPGTLNVTGNYTQSATGELLVDLASASSYDKLNITGNVALDGELEVSLLGFSPAVGDSFQIISGGAVTGAFSNVVLPALADANWHLLYTPTSVLLEVGLKGDYNSDDAIDAADYVLWRKTFGQTGTPLAADGNANNQIDDGDYNVWLENFGEATGGGEASEPSTIPEPSGNILLLFAISFCGSVIGRRVRRLSRQN
jgi:hypothetical protein